MDEQTLRRIVREEIEPLVRQQVDSVRQQVDSVRQQVDSVRDEVRASEERLGEAGRLQFRQLADLYRSTLEKVEHLERHENSHGHVVANYLRDMAELPLSRLFFPSSEPGAARMSATLTVLTMPGLVLPPRSVPREHWSTSEQLAVPLLHLAAWYATRAVYGREMQARKLVALDETHFLGEWSAGRRARPGAAPRRARRPARAGR